MLYLGEIQDDRGERDEDQIEETQRGDKVCCFTEVGTSEKHLEQDLGLGKKLLSHTVRDLARAERQVLHNELTNSKFILYFFLSHHLHDNKWAIEVSKMPCGLHMKQQMP